MSQLGVLGLYDGVDNGCSFYRLISPYNQLRETGWGYDWLPIGDKNKEMANKPENADWITTPSGWAAPLNIASKSPKVVNLLRPIVVALDEDGNELADNGFAEMLLEQVHQSGAIFGGDLDDDMWSVAEHNPAKQNLKANTPAIIADTLKKLDFVTCSTSFLAKRIVQEAGVDPTRIQVVPNLIDFDLYDSNEWRLTKPSADGDAINGEASEVVVSMRQVRQQRLTSTVPRPVVIGLQGGPSHIEDWKIVAPALGAIDRKFGGLVRFMIAGAHFDYLKEALRKADQDGRVTWQKWQPFALHSQSVMCFDINLCPLADTLFNRSKSNIKWLEAAAAGAASVVSPVVYGEAVKPGQTALVANTPEEWERAINFLVTNRIARQEMARLAHAVVRGEYNLQTKAYLWVTAYNKAWQQNKDRVRSIYMAHTEARENARQRQLLATA